MHSQKSFGFTLIEILITVAILGILVAGTLIPISSSRETAKVSESIREVKEIERAMAIYSVSNNNRPPPNCNNQCSVDPLGAILNTDFLMHNHPWGGHYSIFSTTDITGDGRPDVYIMWNDDAPQTDDSDNSGPVPLSAMNKIDATLDDGDLSTGRVVGNGAFLTAANEILFLINI